MANQIAKDTVIAVGGLGTQVDKAELNGGGATKTAWDAGAPGDFIAANGGPKSADTAITYDHAGGTVDRMFSKAGIGTNVTVGTLAYVSGTNITTGIYEITTVAGDDSYVACANIVATDDNADSVLNIGGALDKIQNALDTQDAASYNRYIYDNISTETVTATVKADTYAGSASTKVFVIGYNATLAAEASVILTTTTDITGEAAAVDQSLFSIVTKNYLEFRNINFNAGGKDANRAMCGLYNNDAQYITFYNCNFYGGEADGCYYNSSYLFFVDCEFYLNGRYGLMNNGTCYFVITHCSFHDNDNHGLQGGFIHSTFAADSFYDNGKDGTGNGINLNGSNRCRFISNTLFGNADDGLQENAASYFNLYINNASIGNGAYGYDFSTMGQGDIGVFCNNLAGANTTAHYNLGADNTFADFSHGNNVASAQTADQLLKTITDGSEDLTPETGSDLIDAGLDRTA